MQAIQRQREVKEMVEKTKTKEDEKEFQIVVRGVDPEVWRRARSQAILQRENMGPLALVTMIFFVSLFVAMYLLKR
jgi:hypothetical protein